ncbi:MAG: hypothetical protein U1E56_14105 [Bauldia sp.]
MPTVMRANTPARKAGAAQRALALWAVLCAGLCLFATRVIANPEVGVEANVQAGFGRIVLTFPDTTPVPPFQTRIVNGVLVLSFQQTVPLSLEPITVALKDFITTARRDPDERGLRLGLARGVRSNTLVAGERLFIDLLPAKWSGPPPGIPDDVAAELARRADDAIKVAQAEAQAAKPKVRQDVSRLDLRVGKAATYTRLTFTWSAPFNARFVRNGTKAEIAFDRYAEPDFSPINVDPPPLILGIDKEATDQGLKVMLSLDPAAEVRAYRSGASSYILDITSEQLKAAVPGNDVREPIRAALGEIVESATDTDAGEDPRKTTTAVAAAAAAPGPVGSPAVRGGLEPQLGRNAGMGPATRAAAAPAPAPPAAAQEVAAPGPNASASEGHGAVAKPDPAPPHGAVAPPIAAPPAAAHAPVASPPAVTAGPPAKGPRDPASAGERSQAAVAAPLGAAEGPIAPPAVIDLGATPAVTLTDGFARLVFPFERPVAAAVFRRGNTLFVMFETDAPLDTTTVDALLRGRAKVAGIDRLAGATLVRLTLSAPQLVAATPEGNNWVVTLGDAATAPARRVDIERATRGDGRPVLRANLPGAEAPRRFKDPVAGDWLIVVAAVGPSRGFLAAQQYVELTTVPTAHGLAFATVSDDVSAAVADGIVTVGRDRGLTLSTPPRVADSKGVGAAPSRPGLIGLAQWNAVPPQFFRSVVNELQANIAAAPEQDRPAGQFKLAGAYLSRQLGLESLGLLKLAARGDPGFLSRPEYKLSTAAANYTSGRFQEAFNGLNDEALRANPDAAVWRAVTAAALRDWRQVIGQSAAADSVVRDYPEHISQAYILAIAEAEIESRHDEAALARLQPLAGVPMGKGTTARREMLLGRLAQNAGRMVEAELAYTRAVDSGYRPVAVEAEYRRTMMDYGAGKTTPDKAEGVLSRLAVAWRGDDTELKILDDLADIQVSASRYRQAFASMRAAQFSNRKSEITTALSDRMAGVFSELFLDGKADGMPPVQALGLYYDFRDLTPVGRRGDDMVRKFADRLIDIDLLDQAAEVLQHQIDNRLRGAARAEIAADLAVVNLLNRKPQEALAVLRRTEQAELPPLLERQRRMVQARALAETGQAKQAIDILSALDGDDVERMRIDILWAAKDWRGALAAIERSLGEKWSSPLPLTVRERQDIMRAAIGNAMLANEAGLAAVRSKYTAKMSATPDARAFDTVTRPIGSDGRDLQSVARDLASVDSLRDFLADYRKRYAPG